MEFLKLSLLGFEEMVVFEGVDILEFCCDYKNRKC